MYHCGANGIRYHRCRTEHDGGRRGALRASINNDSIRPIKFSADTISGFQSCGNYQQKLKGYQGKVAAASQCSALQYKEKANICCC